MGSICNKIEEVKDQDIKIQRKRTFSFSTQNIRKKSLSVKPFTHKIVNFGLEHQILVGHILKVIELNFNLTCVLIYYSNECLNYTFAVPNKINVSDEDIINIGDKLNCNNKMSIDVFTQGDKYYVICPLTGENLIHCGFLSLVGTGEKTFTPEEKGVLNNYCDQIIKVLVNEHKGEINNFV